MYGQEQFIPNQLHYTNEIPIRIPTRYKTVRYTPIVYPQSGGYDNRVQIYLKSNAFWDPYSAFWKMTVDFTQQQWLLNTDNPINNDGTSVTNRCIQLDGCAHSLIASMTIIDQGQYEIEKIYYQDVLGNILKDVSTTQFDKFTKSYEGVGGVFTQGMPMTFTSPSCGTGYAWNPTDNNPNVAGRNSMAGDPNINNIFNLYKNCIGQLMTTTDPNSLTSAYFTNYEAKTQFLDVGTVVAPTSTLINVQKAYFNPLKEPHIYKKEANPPNDVLAGYDDTYYTGQYTPNITPVNITKLNSCSAPQFFTRTYAGQQPNDLSGANMNNPEKFLTFNPTTGGLNNIPNWTPAAYNPLQVVEDAGFNDPFPLATAAACLEPIFSAQLPQRYMQNGLPTCVQNLTQTFVFPFLSGVLGILMQPEDHILVPMKAFKDPFVDIQLSQYAFFTSAHTSNQKNRQPLITSIELWVDLADFDDDNILAALDETLSSGIVIKTVSWYNCLNAVYKTLPSEIKVNTGFISLRALLFCFNACDYKYSSAARRQYRLSQNIAGFQIKVGPDVYPQEPVIGLAGCNTGANNNAPFMYHLFKIFGMHMNARNTLINGVNFAVDSREFDYSLVTSNQPTLSMWHPQYQISYFMENRCVGRAVFGYDFDAVSYDHSRVITGINTYDKKPFNIVLNQGGQNGYGPKCPTNVQSPFAVTSNAFNIEINVFGLYDLILKLSPTGTTSEGLQ